MFSPLRARAPAYVERIVLTACPGTLAGAAWLALWLSKGGSLLHLHHMSQEALAVRHSWPDLFSAGPS